MVTHSSGWGGPQVAVSAAPQLWWRHAVRCVLAERRALLGAAVRPAPQAPQPPLASPEFALANPGTARGRRPGARSRKPGNTLPGNPSGLDRARHARAYGAMRSRLRRLAWAAASGGGSAAAAAAAEEAGASTQEAALWRWRVWACAAHKQVQPDLWCTEEGQVMHLVV